MTPAERRDRKLEYRQWIIERAGGACKRCGYDNWRALQFDHVQGDGADDRRKNWRSRASAETAEQAQIVLARIYLGELQVLCANCNMLKVYERNEHYAGRVPEEAGDTYEAYI